MTRRSPNSGRDADDCDSPPSPAWLLAKIRYRNSEVKLKKLGRNAALTPAGTEGDDSFADLRAKALLLGGGRFMRKKEMEKDAIISPKSRMYLMFRRRRMTEQKSAAGRLGPRNFAKVIASSGMTPTTRESMPIRASPVSLRLPGNKSAVTSPAAARGKACCTPRDAVLEQRLFQQLELQRKFTRLRSLLYQRGRNNSKEIDDRVKLALFEQNYRQERSRMTQKILGRIEATNAGVIPRIYRYKMEEEIGQQEETQSVIAGFRTMMQDPRRAVARVERQRLRRKADRRELVRRVLRCQYRDVVFQ